MAMLTIAESATRKGKELIALKATAMKNPGLRVKVVGGGCSGLMYRMEFEDGPREGDQVFESCGFRVYVDPKSLLFLGGSELHYEDGLTGAGFRFTNPHAKNSCGCGESFNV